MFPTSYNPQSLSLQPAAPTALSSTKPDSVSPERPELLYRRALHLKNHSSLEFGTGPQEEAKQIFQKIVQENPNSAIGKKAQRQLDLLQKKYSFADQLEERSHHLLRAISQPDSLAATALAPMAYSMGKLGGLIGLTRPRGLIQHWVGHRGVQSLAYGLGFLAETTTFTATHKIVGQTMGKSQDWHPLTLWQEWSHGTSMLLGMKVMGAVGLQLQQKMNRFSATRIPFSAQMLSRVGARLAPEVSAIGGTMLVPWLQNFPEQGFYQNYQDLFYAGLEMHLSFKGMREILGNGPRAWKQLETFLNHQAATAGEGHLRFYSRRLIGQFNGTWLSPWHPPLAFAMGTSNGNKTPPMGSSQQPRRSSEPPPTTRAKSWDQAWEVAQKYTAEPSTRELVAEIHALLGDIHAQAPKNHARYWQEKLSPANLMMPTKIGPRLRHLLEIGDYQGLQAIYVELCGLYWGLTQTSFSSLPSPTEAFSLDASQSFLIPKGALSSSLFRTQDTHSQPASPVAALWSRGAVYGRALKNQTPLPKDILQRFHHAIRTQQLDKLLDGTLTLPEDLSVQRFFQTEAKSWKQAWEFAQSQDSKQLLLEIEQLERSTQQLIIPLTHPEAAQQFLQSLRNKKTAVIRKKTPDAGTLSDSAIDLPSLQTIYLELCGFHWSLARDITAPTTRLGTTHSDSAGQEKLWPKTPALSETIPYPAAPAAALWSRGALRGKHLRDDTPHPKSFQALLNYATRTDRLDELLDGTLALPKVLPTPKSQGQIRSASPQPQLENRLPELIAAQAYWETPWRTLQEESIETLKAGLQKDLNEITTILEQLKNDFPPGSERRHLVESLQKRCKQALDHQDPATLRALSLQMSGFNAALRGEIPSPGTRLPAAQIRLETRFHDAEGLLKLSLTAEEFNALLRYKNCRTAGRGLPSAIERWPQALSALKEGFRSVNDDPNFYSTPLTQTWADWLRQVDANRTQQGLPFPVSEAELIALSRNLGVEIGKLWRPQFKLISSPLTQKIPLQADEYTKLPPAQALWIHGWFIGRTVEMQRQKLPKSAIEALSSLQFFIFNEAYHSQHNFNFIPPLSKNLEAASLWVETSLVNANTWPTHLSAEALLRHQEVARNLLPLLYRRLATRHRTLEGFKKDFARLSAAIAWGEAQIAVYSNQATTLTPELRAEYAARHGIHNPEKVDLLLKLLPQKLTAQLDKLYRSYLKNEQDLETFQREFHTEAQRHIQSTVRQLNYDRTAYFKDYNKGRGQAR